MIYRAMNLNSVVKDVLEFMEKEITDKNIRLELNLDEGLPEIVSDMGQLQRCLLISLITLSKQWKTTAR